MTSLRYGILNKYWYYLLLSPSKNKNIRHKSNFCSTFVIFILLTVTCTSAHCYVSIATMVRSAQHSVLLHLPVPVRSLLQGIQVSSCDSHPNKVVQPPTCTRRRCSECVHSHICRNGLLRDKVPSVSEHSNIWCLSRGCFSTVHLLIASPYYSLTDFLTPWSRVLQKLTGSQLVKKFPAFYGTRRFITTFTSARHLSLYLSQINPVHASTSHFLNINLNIILPFTSGSSFSQVSPTKLCIRLSSPPYALHAPPISFFSIWSPEQYLLSSHWDPHYVGYSTPLLPRPS